MNFTSFVSMLLFIFSQVRCLYFIMNRNEERCFYDEFYEQLVVTLRYQLVDRFSSINS